MAYFIRVSTQSEPLDFIRNFIPLLERGLEQQTKVYSEYKELNRDGTGLSLVTDVIVALGSAGVFTSLYQAFKAYLSRNKNRELVVETEKGKVSIKGHTLPEESELLTALGLESSGVPEPNSKDKIDS